MTSRAPSDSLRIAFCLPDLAWLRHIVGDESGEAAAIQQGYIAAGLRTHGHRLTYLAHANLSEIAYADGAQEIRTATQTWTRSPWFNASGRTAWRMQQMFRVPYLNVFSNYRYYDACLQCLPGHDVVHERNGIYNQGVAMACRKLNLPYVVFFDADQLAELDYQGKPITGMLRQRAVNILRYNLETAGAVVCVSQAAKQRLIHVWGQPADKIAVFPNGVDVDRFQPCAETRDPVRASLGLAGDQPLIMFVGNFYNWHDVDTLVEAFAQVIAKRPDARLVLVGDGPRRPAMMEKAAALGLGDAARFVGLVPHDEVPKLLSAADVGVALCPPMDSELWLSPMKLFEYMAAGLAIVATATGQYSEVIDNGRNGLLAGPGDAPAVADALLALIDNPRERLEMGRQARADACVRHSWDSYVDRLEEVYCAAMERRPVAEL